MIDNIYKVTKFMDSNATTNNLTKLSSILFWIIFAQLEWIREMLCFKIKI